jgi:biotin carboxyl carrier protein
MLVVQGVPVRCSVGREGDHFSVKVDHVRFHLQLVRQEPGVFHLCESGRMHIVRIAHAQERSFLHVDGDTLEYTTSRSGDAGRAMRTAAAGDLTAPMPGAITQVLVQEGDEVVPGQALVIIEAMKMEHVIRAPRAGTVRAIRARPGDQIEGGAALVEISWKSNGPLR